MVTIGMNYKTLPGKEKIFVDACNGVVKAMEGIDGHSKSYLYVQSNYKQHLMQECYFLTFPVL